MGALGHALSFVVGTAVDVFYRRRVIAGAVPARGPVLLVANHPNGLMDPVVVQNAAGRRVRMLAKAPLFTMPGVSLLVKGLDCLPVYRTKDGADTAQNAATFRSVEEALRDGGCVLIFPEGISHDEPQVQPLKTGAARMALSAFRNGVRDLVIVPVGLTYADKLRYRSTAAVDIGAPIRVADFAVDDEHGGGDADRAAVLRLTAAIHDALRAVTVNVESWEDAQLLNAVDAIWRQDDPERTRRLKNLADGVAFLRAHDPASLDDVRARLSEWVDRLGRLGLEPRDVAPDVVAARRSPARLAQFLARQVAAVLFAFPLALLGAIVWFVPFWLAHAVWLALRPARDVGATVKVLASLVFFPLWFVVMTVAVSLAVSPWAALALALVAPGAGLVTRHFFRRRFFALRQVFTGIRLVVAGRWAAGLARDRDGFVADFDRLAARVEALRASPPAASSTPGGRRDPRNPSAEEGVLSSVSDEGPMREGTTEKPARSRLPFRNGVV